MAKIKVTPTESTKELRFVSRCIDRLERAYDWLEACDTLKEKTHRIENLKHVNELLREWKKEPISSQSFGSAFHAKNIASGYIGHVVTEFDNYGRLRNFIRTHLEISLNLLYDEREVLQCFIHELKTLDLQQ